MNHCLNLVFVAFLQPIETKFGLQKLLRSIRAYIKSGGGQSRRAQLCEHGLSLSGIDFTVTRWSSFYGLFCMLRVHSPSMSSRPPGSNWS